MSSVDANLSRFVWEKLTSPIGESERPSIDTFMMYHDEIFVSYAYYALLGRAADQGGMRYYIARLRQGKSRFSVLAQLVASDETRQDWADIPGLAAALDRYRKSRKWAGWFKFRRDSELSIMPWARQARIFQNGMEAQTQYLRFVTEKMENQNRRNSELLALSSTYSKNQNSENSGSIAHFYIPTPRTIDDIREQDVPNEIIMVVGRLNR